MADSVKWEVGQPVVIGRSKIAFVEKVSPTGRVTAGGKTFKPDGWEYGGGYRGGLFLQPLTEKLAAQINLAKRAVIVGNAANLAAEYAAKWIRETFGGWQKKEPSAADVEKAERLAAAIRSVMVDAT